MKTQFSRIPNELKALPNWVCVWENSKIPMQALIKKGASASNPETWTSYATALNAVQQGLYDYLGFVFDNNGIVGIDIDCGFDSDGFLTETGADIMSACESYTERSRSGRGVHIYVRGTLPFKGKNNRNGVEIYSDNRFFIVTGETLIYDSIIDNQAAIDYVLDTYFPEVRPENTEDALSNKIYAPLWAMSPGGRIPLRPVYPPIGQGMRNLSLTSLAGQLHQQGYGEAEVYQELIRANGEACTPPLPLREIQTIVNSVTRYRR